MSTSLTYDIAGLCVESEPARSRHRCVNLVLEVTQRAAAAKREDITHILGYLFNLWDSPPMYANTPSVHLQPKIAEALLQGVSSALTPLAIEGEPSNEQLSGMLRDSVVTAGTKLDELIAGQHMLYAGAGATMLGMAAGGNRLAMGWLGDVRAYRIRHGQTALLTVDHTLRSDALRLGATEEQVESLPEQVITRFLGSSEHSVQLEFAYDEWKPGDMTVVVSPQVHRVVNVPQMSAELSAADSAHDAASMLIAKAVGLCRGQAFGVLVLRRAPRNFY